MKGIFRTSVVGIFIFTATILLTVFTVNKWFNPLYRDTVAWVETVTPLAGNPKVQAAIEQYVLTETFTKIDVEKIVADALPEQASFLAAPIASAVQDVAQQVVNKIVQSPQFEEAWVVLNKTIHTQLQAIISGEIDPNKPIQLDLKTLVSGVQQQGVQSLLPVLTDYVTQRAIIRLEIQQYIPALQALAKYSDRILEMGIVIIAFFMTGIALAKKRSFAVMGSGVMIIFSGAAILVAVKTLIGEMKMLSVNPIMQSAIIEITTQITAGLVVYARELAAAGIVILLIGLFTSSFGFAKALRKLLGLSWIAKKIKKFSFWKYVRITRTGVYTYRSGIIFGAFIIMVLYLIFAPSIDVMAVMKSISWWMIFLSFVLYFAAKTTVPVVAKIETEEVVVEAETEKKPKNKKAKK